jgi:uncharacterized protein (TIGR02597 family)
MKFPVRLALLAAAFLPAAALFADTVTSDISGYLKISAPATTDTPISPVFARDTIWRSTVSSVSGATITVSGTPNWTAGALAPGANTYYVRLTSGALKGQFLTITGNATGSVTVDNAGLNLASLTAGDALEIAPYWTLGTLYPAGDAGTKFIASSSTLVRQTELLFFDASTSGINRAPSSTYYFYNGAWRKFGADVTVSFDSTIIYPDNYFIQRNKASATTVVLTGRVMPAFIGTILEGAASKQNDNYIALSYPADVTLARSGLASNGFSASSSPLNISDKLLLFDPAVTGYNRAPAATYYYYNSGWRKFGGDVTVDYSSTVTIPAGSGFIIRKAANAASSTWQFDTQL